MLFNLLFPKVERKFKLLIIIHVLVIVLTRILCYNNLISKLSLPPGLCRQQINILIRKKVPIIIVNCGTCVFPS